MSHERAWIATKKGLFELRLRGKQWNVERISFLGEPVTMVLPPAAGDTAHAGLADHRALRHQGSRQRRCRR